MSKKKKIIIAVVAVVVAAAVAVGIYLAKRDPSKYYDGNGERVSIEKYQEIALEFYELNDYEIECIVNDMTFNFRTTLKEMLDSDVEFEGVDNLDADTVISDEDNWVRLKLKGSKDVIFEFSVDETPLTAEKAEFCAVVGGSDVYVEGTKLDFGKTTIKDMIDNGWTLLGYDSIPFEGEYSVDAYFSKDGKGIRVESTMETDDADVKTAVITYLD